MLSDKKTEGSASSSRTTNPWEFLSWAAGFTLLGMLLLWHQGALDHDVFHEMALAREIFKLGYVPTQEPFAYTQPVDVFVHHEWGSGVIFYLATLSWGISGLVALKMLLISVMALFVYACARTKGASWRLVLITGPIAIYMVISFVKPVVRAQHISLMLLPLLLLLLEKDRQGQRWWIALWVPLHLLWLNLHAGFVMGLGVLALYALERLIREHRIPWHIVGAGLAGGALVVINPYGLHYYSYLWHALTLPRALITEWQPMWHTPELREGVFLLSLLPLFYVWYRRGWDGMRGLPLLLVCAYLAITHVRHLAVYAVVWACYMPAWMEQCPLGTGLAAIWHRQRRVVAAVLSVATLTALSVLLAIGKWGVHPSVGPDDLHADHSIIYPVGAVDYLDNTRFRGNIMTPFNGCGSYVMWRLYPRVKVGMDSRYEVGYDPDMFVEAHNFYLAKDGWRATLKKYPTDLVLVRKDYPLLSELEKTDWKRVYRDAVFQIFARPSLDLPVSDRRGDKLDFVLR